MGMNCISYGRQNNLPGAKKKDSKSAALKVFLNAVFRNDRYAKTVF